MDFFREGESFVAYCPVLDLSTCGATYDQAAEAFGEALSIFLEECTNRGTLDEVLQSCGWEVKKTGSERRITPPLFVGQRQVSLSIPPIEECPA